MSGLLNKVVFGIYNTVIFVRRSFGEVNAMASKTGGRTTCRSNQSDGCSMLNFPLGPMKVEQQNFIVDFECNECGKMWGARRCKFQIVYQVRSTKINPHRTWSFYIR